MCPDHTSQGLCEVKLAAPDTDVAGLAPVSEGERGLWFYTALALHSLGTPGTVNTSLLQPRPPILWFLFAMLNMSHSTAVKMW